MAEVAKITPHVRRLEAPPDLRQLPGWLTWRREQHPGEEKPRKVPFYADGGRRHGRQGSPQDRAKLVTFDAAKAAAARRGFDGVGLAMLPEWGISALDFDHCIDAQGNIPDEITAIIGNTYSEFSPSGTGIRAFVKGNLGDRKDLNNAAYPWSLEVFTSSGYVTFTGNPLLTTEVLGLEETVAVAGREVLDLCARRFGAQRDNSPTSDDPFDTFEPVLGLTTGDIEGLLSDLDPSMSRDAWIQVAMAIHHETEGEGFDLFDEWSAGGHQYPGTEALQMQWDSFDRREINRRPITMGTVRKMSAEARAAQGLPPRLTEALLAAAADAKQELATATPKARLATPEDYRGKFPIISGGQFAKRPAPKWIIKGVIPDADLGVIFGASGSGKSFEVLDMGLAIARGIEWRGLKVQQRRVLLIAAEGGGGMATRLRAYEVHHNVVIDDCPFGVMHSVPNFMVEDDITEILGAIVAAGGVDLIIVDTFAQVTSGANENSGEDMGKALRHARLIREVTGAMVLMVHHSGKDASKGARGWSGIRAATDVELEVIRPELCETRMLRTSKQKDGRDDLAWGFDLVQLIVSVDADGDDDTSLVSVEAEVPVAEPRDDSTPVGPEQIVVELLRDSEFGDGLGGLALDDLSELAAERLGTESVDDLIVKLCERGVVAVTEGVATVCD